MSLLSIGQVAKETGVTVETVRFYEKQGLIDEPSRSESGYRQYPQGTTKRVHFIQHAKEVGFTLKEVAELLALRREPGTSCSDIKIRTTQKIESVDQKIRDLQIIREALSRMILKCSGGDDLSTCPILEELDMVKRAVL